MSFLISNLNNFRSGNLFQLTRIKNTRIAPQCSLNIVKWVKFWWEKTIFQNIPIRKNVQTHLAICLKTRGYCSVRSRLISLLPKSLKNLNEPFDKHETKVLIENYDVPIEYYNWLLLHLGLPFKIEFSEEFETKKSRRAPLLMMITSNVCI